ncbi:MAG: alpha-L-fucosidase [Planctomycetes bacterium]|nr:alpha-L-fucosidase [Planctomycetota bacterium]
MMRARTTLLLSLTTTVLLLATSQAASAEPDLAKPTPIQAAWQDLEIGMFIHYDFWAFKRDVKQWHWKDISPDLYYPKKLDTDQWVRTAKAMGAKYAILTAKHGTGFLQWQSDAYPFGLKQSRWRNGKGDLVRDFVESCRKYGIKPGIYCHLIYNDYLEIGHPGKINRGKGDDPQKQARYAEICEQMLTELLGNYGPLVEIWFDGGALPPENGGPNIGHLIKKYQPHAVVFQSNHATIRWVGNESGVAGYPCWSTVPSVESIHTDRNVQAHGDPNGSVWMPGECDVTLPGHGWNWTPDQDPNIQPLEALMEIYYKSVGRNCNLLLNATPNDEGLIPEANVKHYIAFGKEIARRFGKSVKETEGRGHTLTLSFDRPTIVDHVVIMEDIMHGERVRAYVVEALRNKTWCEIVRGISIGHKKIDRFKPTEVSKLRFRCTKSAATPVIRKFAAYNTTVRTCK